MADLPKKTVTEAASIEPAPLTAMQPKQLPWSPVVAVIIVVATYFLASIFGEACILFYGLINHWSVHRTVDWATNSNVAQFFSFLLMYGAMAAAIYWFIRSHKISLKSVGLINPRFRDFGIMLIAVPVYVGAYIVLLSVATSFFPGINTNQQQQLGFQPSNTFIDILITFISLVVLPPLVEEFIMRGFLFTSLLKRYNFWISTLVTSALFATAHLQIGSGAPLLWTAAIDTFSLSLVLCYMRYKTGSLWPGILLHAAKNCFAFLSLFVFHFM